MNEIQEYDLVALTEDAIAYALKHEMTRRSPSTIRQNVKTHLKTS